MSSRAVLTSGSVVLLLVGALAGYLYGVNSTPTKTTTVFTTPDAYDQVASTYANHLLLFDSKNMSTTLTSGFEGNATIEWKRVTNGLTGNYDGSFNIQILLGTFLTTKVDNFLVSNET
jgi:hypothetical protein